MFYVDSQKTVTRRSSSLVVTRNPDYIDPDLITVQAPTSAFTSESAGSLSLRRGSVQEELVTMMFESMLGCIVHSWETVTPTRKDDSYLDFDNKSPSESTVIKKKKELRALSSRTSKIANKRIQSKTELLNLVSRWPGADEKAIIKFKNGNQYEGNIFMKCMHGEGRFQWADGTIYLGQFKNNEMNGKGTIHWKDDTWYQGEFYGNLRHGKGLYVDSRSQRSYAGDWYCGTKHGEGVIYYSHDFKNSYSGQWIRNERYGYGSREYSDSSGFKGDWERNIREGNGLMIWPNHDFYRGDWKNGVMSGYGFYIWDTYYNNTMAAPSISSYRGTWEKGVREGYGVLGLGLGLGTHYKGAFKDGRKEGPGKFITSDGLVLQSKYLCMGDNLGPFSAININNMQEVTRALGNPHEYNMSCNTNSLLYHVYHALDNIDKQAEIRANIVNDYLKNNKISVIVERKESVKVTKASVKATTSLYNMDDLISFEEFSLRKALSCYEKDILNIYKKYATICNNKDVAFTPVLIRLFLWQLYYDCCIHDKGLTLVEIDNIFYKNPEWLARSPHNPFEKIYLWQFIHSLISVASRLYAKRELPGNKPDTILANAFRFFMENDVIPGTNTQRGYLVHQYGQFVPLKATYKLYQEIGEPHKVRDFIRAVRRPIHYGEPQPSLIEPLDSCVPLGKNTYVFGDELTFVVDDELPEVIEGKEDTELKLFNFGNLSTRTLIKIFSNILPGLIEKHKILNLDVEITFYEFFEAFIQCAEKSVLVKEEELKWREKLEERLELALQIPHSPPVHHPHGSKNK